MNPSIAVSPRQHLATKPAYNNSYSNKINAEYEEIKKSILQKTSTTNDTSTVRKFNQTSSYDSVPPIDQKPLTHPVVYKFEDLGIYEEASSTSNHLSRSMIETSDIFDEILKQVERCTSQAEQLEKLDEVEVSYAIYDDKAKTAPDAARTPTNENGRSEFMPFYQVSEELIIEESFNVKKSAKG